VSEPGDQDRLLDELVEEERLVSKRRARLHERIDFLRGTGTADGTPASPEQLEALDEQERELSKTRKELHARIKELRAGNVTD
jgi:hypothetical protein